MVPGLSEPEKMAVCERVAEGRGVAHALSELGRYMDDFNIAMEDPEFRREYEMALAVRDEHVEAALHRKAKKGNVPAIKFWLTNRRPTDWMEMRTMRHVGHDGGAVEVTHTVSALRELITSPETRDQAIAWIESGAEDDITDAEVVEHGEPRGAIAPGEDSESGEAG